MRKILAIALAAVMLTTVGAVFASADYGLIYTALKGTPVIDGTIDDIWNDPNLEWTSVEHPHSTETKWDDGTLRVKVLWDEENLYFLAEATAAAEQDVYNNLFEIYVSEENTKVSAAYSAGDSQTCVRLVDGTFVTASDYTGGEGPGSNTKAAVSEAKVWKDGDTYYAEVRTPFATIDGTAGDVLGLEFMYNVLGENRAFVNALRWNVDTVGTTNDTGDPDPAPWQGTEAWGDLVLSATEATAPAVDESTGDESTGATPDTGDEIVVFAVLGLFALAATVVVVRKAR